MVLNEKEYLKKKKELEDKYKEEYNKTKGLIDKLKYNNKFLKEKGKEVDISDEIRDFKNFNNEIKL